MINFAVGKFIKTIGIMTNKFKKGDNVKIRRDQTGGVWQVKEVKERECDKGHPETRFIYLCEEVDSKHQQWIKEERLDEWRSEAQELVDEYHVLFERISNQLKIPPIRFKCSGEICAGALAELERASRKSWLTTSTNEIKVEGEPKFKVGDWVRDEKGNAKQVLSVRFNGWMNIGDKDWVSSAHQSMVESYEPKDNEFYWVEGNIVGLYIVCDDYSLFSPNDGNEPFLETTREPSFSRKLHTRRPATPTEKDYLIKAVEKQYNKTYNEETKQWEDMVAEWTPQPFERVLVRGNDEWGCDLYNYKKDKCIYLIGLVCVNAESSTIIPYKGNEALLGTTDECKTKYKIK